MRRISILLLLVICLLLSSCHQSPESTSPELDDIELGSTEYDRVGNGKITVSTLPPISLNEAYEQAESVVRVQITDMYGTYNYKSGSDGVTVFSAIVLETYNDCETKTGDEILISQMGTPNATVIGFPLFKIGDIMLICLEEEDRTVYEGKYPETVYYIINGRYGVLQEIGVDGKKYIVNRAHKDYCKEIISSKVSDSERTEVLGALYDYDPILTTQTYGPFEIYDSDTVEEYLEGIK